MPTFDSAFQRQPSFLPRWLRIILLTLIGLAVIITVAFAGFLIWLRMATAGALPALDGEVHLAGLSAPVTVNRDAHGVPHIEAATQDDLFTAQGYVTAQDRLWQMDAFRRNSLGELSEVMGPSLVKHDETQRSLMIGPVAERMAEHQDPDDRRRFEDYARGVNLFIAQCEQNNTLPIEFKLLHYKPRPWTVVDSMSVVLMMVEELDTHAWAKYGRMHVAAKLNDAKLEADLYPVGSWRDHPPTGVDVDLTAPHPELQPPAGDDDESTQAGLARVPKTGTLGHWHLGTGEGPDPTTTALLELLGLPTCDSCAYGSNNWVIAGSHTASGKPLLANDMHLAPNVPGIWYMADLNAPGFHSTGVTLAGLPFVIAGHNEHVAWGFTAAMADVQDLYIEKLDGHGNYEGLDAQWHPLTVDHETIHVRFGKDVTLDVQSTAHGPLMNRLLEPGDPPIALKWTIYDPTLNAIPLFAMNTASNWTEFSAAIAEWPFPAQNLVYDDDQGHIAYHMVGKVPIRGGNGKTIFDEPIPHNMSDSEWGYSACAGICPYYIPFDQMPNAFDPPSGFLATANSRVTTDQSPYKLTDEWID
ncbi:MAG TPA: penicillin acylase family protein, partial [Terracidiphilus sp.]|nr:penicillin acylase family protein [Terracidiphilus sp.]